MAEQAVFYQLARKLVGTDAEVPADARQVVYYSLAIGHHVGIMDCLRRLVSIPIEEYAAWLDQLPPGAGRDKLAGLLKWGEIEINHGHAAELAAALRQCRPRLNPSEAGWTAALLQSLQAMMTEPALYLMARRRAE
jgi:hypothetical protein